MHLLLLFTLLFPFIGNGKVQGHTDHSCKSLVLEAYQAINAEAGPHKAYIMDYKVVAHYTLAGAEEVQHYAIQTNLKINHRVLNAENAEVLLARNEHSQLIINKKSRQIVFLDAVPTAIAQTSPWAGIREELLQSAKVRTCLLSKDRTTRLVTLELPERLKAEKGINSITFQIKQATGQLKGFELFFRENYPIRKQLVQILRMDIKPASDVDVKSPEELVFGKTKQLLPVYKNYTLIDNRSK